MLITDSTTSPTVWQCRHCPAPMVPTTTPAGEPAIECTGCRWTVDAARMDILQPFPASDVLQLAALDACYELALDAYGPALLTLW